MKTYKFIAYFSGESHGSPVSYICESPARVHGSFGAFIDTQQHNQAARKAFLADLTGHRDAEPESLSIELQGHFIPIY